MRKTVSISISGMLFHVEEQAYKKLEQYLSSIRSHFATYEDEAEIVSDIENRIAEHFTEKVNKSKKVISEADVDDLITHMGTVKDFAEFEGEQEHVHAEKDIPTGSPKRLYRDPDNQMIAGVAAGIANYFGIDPTIMRLLFLLTLIPGGTGILIYIILWIVLPEAKTTSDKVEMRGHQLTLKRIEAAIREKVPAAAEKIRPGTFTRIIQFPFMILRQILNFLGRIIKFIVPLILRIIGLALIIAASVGIFFLTFSFIMLFVNAWEAYMDVPIRELAGNGVYYTTLVSGYLVGLFPAIMVIILGSSLLLMRNQFRFPAVISLSAVWMCALLVGSVTVAREMPALHDEVNQYVETHDTAAAKTLDLPAFKSVEAHSGYDINIVKGTGSFVRVSGSKTMVDALSATVDEEGTLLITRANGKNRFCIICLSNSAVIDITVPGTLANISAYAGTTVNMQGVDLTGERIVSSGGTRVVIKGGQLPENYKLDAMGGARIDIETTDSVSNLAIEGMGGSRIVYKGNARDVTLTQYAGTTVELTGSGGSLTAEVNAGSNLRASEFSVQNATIDAYAGGTAEVNVKGILKGSAYAGGNIRHVGRPASIEIENEHSGEVEQMMMDDDMPDYWDE